MGSISVSFLAIGLLWYVVFVFSTVLHEAAHALVAKRGGDPTAARGGQVTLDPMPHMRREPFGMVLVPILTYFLNGWMIGWASAPYDPYWANRYPRRAALMSLAGPAANLSLVVASGLSIRVAMLLGFFSPPARVSFTHLAEASSGQPSFVSALALFLSIIFMLNLVLGFFNLLPVPPLDGSTGITLFMSRETSDRWTRFIHQPRLALIGLLAAWILFPRIFGHVFSLALFLLYPEVGYS